MILIGGGTGFIGRNLASFLRMNGFRVIVVTRNPLHKDHISWSAIENDGIPENVRCVVNLAGRSIGEMSPLYFFNSYYKIFKQELFDSRLETNKILVKAIRKSPKPPETFLSASAIGFYKPSLTETFTEESPYIDYGFVSELCKQWEETAQLVDRPDIKQIQIRIGLVLGSNGGLLQNLYNPFRLGLGGSMGTGEQWFPWIHLVDIVQLIHWALFNKSLTSGPLNATAPNPVRYKDFVTAFGRVLGKPTLLTVPAFSVKLILGERANLLLEGSRVIPKKALDNGFRFKYTDISDALRSIYG